MAQTIRITYYGMDGEGATVKDAKLDAGRKIEQALSGAYNPKLLVLEGHAILLARSPQGYGYSIVTDGEKSLKPGMVWATSNFQDESEAEAYARYHLAQIAWNWNNDADVIEYVFKDDQARIQSWITWQRNYKQLREEGCTDAEAHEKAFA